MMSNQTLQIQLDFNQFFNYSYWFTYNGVKVTKLVFKIKMVVSMVFRNAIKQLPTLRKFSTSPNVRALYFTKKHEWVNVEGTKGTRCYTCYMCNVLHVTHYALAFPSLIVLISINVQALSFV